MILLAPERGGKLALFPPFHLLIALTEKTNTQSVNQTKHRQNAFAKSALSPSITLAQGL
jgi:hypothetical protein